MSESVRYYPSQYTSEWIYWLDEHVGNYSEHWWWNDMRNGSYIEFVNDEDATAFRLKFKL